jgi:hypothetical protein
MYRIQLHVFSSHNIVRNSLAIQSYCQRFMRFSQMCHPTPFRILWRFSMASNHRLSRKPLVIWCCWHNRQVLKIGWKWWSTADRDWFKYLTPFSDDFGKSHRRLMYKLNEFRIYYYEFCFHNCLWGMVNGSWSENSSRYCVIRDLFGLVLCLIALPWEFWRALQSAKRRATWFLFWSSTDRQS